MMIDDDVFLHSTLILILYTNKPKYSSILVPFWKGASEAD